MYKKVKNFYLSFFLKKAKKLGVLSPLKFISDPLQAILVGAVRYHLIQIGVICTYRQIISVLAWL